MKTVQRAWAGPKLPPPPPQPDDPVNDLGWLSRGPSRRARREAQAAIAPMFLGDEEWENRPAPAEPPPLPPPPPQDPEVYW